MGFLTILAHSAAVMVMATGGGHAARTPQSVSLPDTGQITTHMVDAGRGIFHGQGGCFACHGMDLQGSAVAPPLDKKGKPWKDAKEGTYAAIFGVVTHGVPGTIMVPHPNGISDALATEVAAYIWAVNHHGAKP